MTSSTTSLLFATALRHTRLVDFNVLVEQLVPASLTAFRACEAAISLDTWLSYSARPQFEAQGGRVTAINNEFFRHQTDHVRYQGQHLPEFEALPAFQDLKAVFAAECSRFLQDCGHSEADAQDLVATQSMVLWSSVHFPGSSHPPHVHSDSMVSGVAYLQVPTDCVSPIVFADPRGRTSFDHLVRMEANLRFGIRPGVDPAGTPPFNLLHEHHPQPGDVLTFPPWLVHEVAPHQQPTTDEPQARVSFSFNLLGSWEPTARQVVVVPGGLVRGAPLQSVALRMGNEQRRPSTIADAPLGPGSDGELPTSGEDTCTTVSRTQAEDDFHRLLAAAGTPARASAVKRPAHMPQRRGPVQQRQSRVPVAVDPPEPEMN